MIICFDTSALLKLYLEEPGSNRVRQAVSAADACLAHILAYVEMRAAFAQARRIQRISQEDADHLVTSFDRDWATFQTIDVDDHLVLQAGQLADRFGLCGYDSVHLAAAKRTWEVIAHPARFGLATFDAKLAKAAQKLEIPVVN